MYVKTREEKTEFPSGLYPPPPRPSSYDIVDLKDLSGQLWNGAPFEYPELRATSWRLLLGVAPAAKDRHFQTLARKRKEYHESVLQYDSMRDGEEALVRQIKVGRRSLVRVCMRDGEEAMLVIRQIKIDHLISGFLGKKNVVGFVLLEVLLCQIRILHEQTVGTLLVPTGDKEKKKVWVVLCEGKRTTFRYVRELHGALLLPHGVRGHSFVRICSSLVKRKKNPSRWTSPAPTPDLSINLFQNPSQVEVDLPRTNAGQAPQICSKSFPGGPPPHQRRTTARFIL